MRFLDIIEDVKTISNVKDDDKLDLIKRSIQQSLDRVYQAHDWPYYLQEGALETQDDYSTGTVAVTNGSKTVTGTSTAWDTTWVNKKFRVQNENAYYRIASVSSTTSLTLEQNYQGDTDSALSYEIYQDEYRLPADVDKYKTLRQIENALPLISYHPTKFDRLFPAPQSYADPVFEIMSGTQIDTYTTGTVSGTAQTSVITGSGTSWASVEGAGRLTQLQIGDNLYNVKSVDSDTQITIYETLSSNIASSTSYTLILDNLRVQLYQIPDEQRLIYLRYFRLPIPLVNNYDSPDMPRNYHYLLKWGALSDMFAQKGDISKSENTFESRFLNGIATMKVKIGSFTPDRVYRRKSTDRVYRGLNDGLESSNYDRRWSMPRY